LRASGIRPIIWGDQLLDPKQFESYIAGGTVTGPAIEKLSRDFIIADWQYDIKAGQDKSFRFFQEQGFDVLPAPWWNNGENIRALSNSAKQLHLTGVLGTTWHVLVKHPQIIWLNAACGWERNPVSVSFSHLNSITMKLCGSQLDYRSSGWGPYEVYYRND